MAPSAALPAGPFKDVTAGWMEEKNSGSNVKVYATAGFPEREFGAQNRAAAEGLPS
jgi:hypothetical protein